MLCRVSMRSCGRCGALVRNDMAVHHICSTRLNAADETHKRFKPGLEGLTCLNKFCSVSPQGGGGAINWWTIRLLFLRGDVQVYWFYFSGVPCFWIFPILRLRVFINVRDGGVLSTCNGILHTRPLELPVRQICGSVVVTI